MKKEKLLKSYIKESLKIKKRSFLQFLVDLGFDVKSVIKSPLDLIIYGNRTGSYISPPKKLEKDLNISGISKDYIFPDSMSGKEFEENILCWTSFVNFQFVLGSKKSGNNKLSKKDFIFIIKNNPGIKKIFEEFNFKNLNYSSQRRFAYNVLMGMTSCFNEKDIYVFAKTRLSSNDRNNHPDVANNKYEFLYKEVDEKIKNFHGDNFDRDTHGIRWIPSIDTLKKIKDQL